MKFEERWFVVAEGVVREMQGGTYIPPISQEDTVVIAQALEKAYKDGVEEGRKLYQ
jgi:hypothetical protein